MDVIDFKHNDVTWLKISLQFLNDTSNGGHQIRLTYELRKIPAGKPGSDFDKENVNWPKWNKQNEYSNPAILNCIFDLQNYAYANEKDLLHCWLKKNVTTDLTAVECLNELLEPIKTLLRRNSKRPY